MRMLRRMCGDMKSDKIRHERISGITKVGEITKKVQDKRLKWCGQVMRRGRAQRRKEGDGNESTKEREERETRRDEARRDETRRGEARRDETRQDKFISGPAAHRVQKQKYIKHNK